MRRKTVAASYTDNGAYFSECGRYRYTLWRHWGAGDLLHFLMLNPSTADSVANDPTVERCERRARAWGYAGVVITNLFAYRATDPEVMKAAADPVGPENDAQILGVTASTALTVCAWGEHGAHLGRSQTVRKLLQAYPLPLAYLRVNKSGEPAHPLYLPYTLQPVLFAKCGR